MALNGCGTASGWWMRWSNMLDESPAGTGYCFRDATLML